MGERGYGARPKNRDISITTAMRDDLPWMAEGLSLPAQVVEFLQWLPITSGSLAGQKVKLLPFQIDFIEATFGEDADGNRPIRRSILSVARKNGKSFLAAGLCLCALIGPLAVPRGQVISAAASRDQASLIFAEMKAIIEAVPYCDDLINVKNFINTLEVREGVGKGSVYKPLSADSRTAHGLSPHFAVYDEYAQAKNDELYQALATGSGARDNACLMVISTQAADDAAPLSRLIDYGKDVMAGRIDDPTTHLALYAADLEDDPFDESTWHKTNPALGVFRSLADMRAQATVAKQSASAEPAFRNLLLNQRIAAETRFLNRTEWDRCNGKPEIEDGADVFGGLDLSWSRDLTALVFVAPRPDGSKDVVGRYFLPAKGLKAKSDADRVPWGTWAAQGHLTTCSGAVIDIEDVADAILDAQRRWNVKSIAYDRWGSEILKLELSRRGVEVELIEHGQGYRDMSPAVDCVERHIAEGKIRHGADPVLTMCAANVIVTMSPDGSRKFDKSRAAGRIDGMVALMMAVNAADMHEEVEEPLPLYLRQLMTG